MSGFDPTLLARVQAIRAGSPAPAIPSVAAARAGVKPVKPGGKFQAPAVHNLGDLLDWQRNAIYEQRFRQHDPDANMKAMRQDMGVEGFYEKQHPDLHNPVANRVGDFLDHLGRGTIDQAIQMGTDPLTYETLGVGPLARRVLLPALAPVLSRVGGVASRFVPGAVKNAFGEGKTVAHALGNLYQTWMTPAGKAGTTAGRKAAYEAMGLEARQSAHEVELGRRFAEMYEQATNGLNDAEKTQVFRILHGELTPHGAPQNVADAVGLLDRLRKSALYMKAEPGSGLRTRVAFAAQGPRVPGAVAPRRVIHANDIPYYSAKRLGLSQSSPAEALPLMEDALKGITPEQRALYESARVGRVPMEDVPENVREAFARAHSIADDHLRAMADALRNAQREDKLVRNVGGPMAGEPAEDYGGAFSRSDFRRGPFGSMKRETPEKRTYSLRGIAKPEDYELPPELRNWGDIAGDYTPFNYRRNYLPGPRQAKEVDPNRVIPERNPIKPGGEPFDPHKLTQENFVVHGKDAELYDDAFRGMLANTARTVTNNDLIAAMKREFPGGVPEDIANIFTRPERHLGESRSDAEKVNDFWKKVISLPRIGVIGTSPRHMINVFSLFANTAGPDAFANALARFTKLQTVRDPAERFEYVKRAVDMGIDAPFEEHGTTLGRIPVLGHISRGINKATWDWDLAATWSLADELLAKGEASSPREAGQLARDFMVNYHRPSLLAQKLKPFMPFSTFETQIPRAVVKGVLRNPVRAAAVNRATGGYFLGKTSGGPDYESKTQYYGPTAKVGRLFDLSNWTGGTKNPLADYARSAMGDPIRFGIEGLVGNVTHHYFNYGKPLSPTSALEAATSWVPYSREVLNKLKLGEFPSDNLGNDLLTTSTGLHLPVAAGKDAISQRAFNASVTRALGGAANQLEKYKGDTDGADILREAEQALKDGDRTRFAQLMQQFRQHTAAPASGGGTP